MTAAKVRLAQTAMKKPETKIAKFCKELGITRLFLYRHVCLGGTLRLDGEKLLRKN